MANRVRKGNFSARRRDRDSLLHFVLGLNVDLTHRERQVALARELGEEVTCDGLTRDFVMFQRRRGHRHSTDDLLTAWYASLLLPSVDAPRLLDLGSGIGSIGLAVLWFARARGQRPSLTAIEAQSTSFRLLEENVAANRVPSLVTAIHGDLREARLPDRSTFDLVTGSPPYFDVKAGIMSADSQRAHARFELRGDVRDYARAATRVLAPGGRFVLCFPTVQRCRAEDACAAAGLSLVRSRDVVPREGSLPLFSLFAYALESRAPALNEPPFVVRDRDGVQTPALLEARGTLGLGGAGIPHDAAAD